MIVALSRFKVANGLESAVHEAFLRRPHLVDLERGFLGMETFTDSRDPTLIFLVTRWTDEPSFRSWHSSAGHHHSHQFIPRGLKLDPSMTALTILQPITDHTAPQSLQEMCIDHAPLLASFLEQTRTVYLVTASPDGLIRFCNSAMADALGSALENMVGQPIWEWLSVADTERLKQRIQSGVREPKQRFLIHWVNAAKAPFTLESQCEIQPDGFVLIGEAPGKAAAQFETELVKMNNELAVLTRENAKKSRALERALSELKEAQSMLVHREKMASVGQMTAGIAHEINTPLGFVTNNQHTLKRDFDDMLSFINVVGDSLESMHALSPDICEIIVEKARAVDLTYLTQVIPEKLSANLEGLERVRTLVTDLRSFSRLDEADMKEVDIASCALLSLRFLGPMARGGGVILTTDLPPLEPILCSPAALNQAITNVVANALQASASGQTVHVASYATEDYYVVQVVDAGTGIAAEHLPKIFDPFFTTKAIGEGTGLGLTIAHQVVSAHGGKITVESRQGEGTTMRLWIPRHPGGTSF